MTRKQTSAKVSKLAAKYLAMSDMDFWNASRGTGWEKLMKDIRTLAASCLSQDEVKGGKPSAGVRLIASAKQARKLSKVMVSARNVDGVVSVTKRKVKP